MGKKKDLLTKSNKGFSLITVILAVGLVGILVMLVAYMVIANFRMKMSGLKEKDAFYTAERALEEIRTGLQEDVAEAMSEAYTSVMESYNRDSNTTDTSMDAQRQAAYEKEFLNILQNRLKGNQTVEGCYDMDKIRAYVDVDKEDTFDSTKESLVVTNITADSSSGVSGSGGPLLLPDYTKKTVTVKNLKVIYVDEKGHAAIIQTDIRLGVPQIPFPTPSTLPDLMNMIVVAGKGIYCEKGSTTGDNEIQGSVYAGILPETKLANAVGVKDASIYLSEGTTLKVSKGERVVCAGEVTLAKESGFSSAGETTLWAQGIGLTSANVELLGKTYLSDDLTVNAGTGSYVKISGDYYGYGDVESALKSRNRIEYGYPDDSSTDSTQTTQTYEEKTAAALSSAITINGKNTTLDMSGLERLLLAGRNYIASKVLSTTGAPGSGTSSSSNSDNVLTGESITVKGTQLAYLVPDTLFDSGYHNPMSYDEYMTAAGINATDNAKTVKGKIKTFAEKKVSTTTVVKALGNKSLSDLGADVQTIFYSDGGASDGGYVYFYLNFSNGKKASEFMQNYYNNNPSLKEAMNGYLSFYFAGTDSGIYLKDSSTYLRYITGGNVLSYDGGKKSGKLTGSTTEETSSAVTEEEIGYQNMWYALKRKMIGSYDLLKKEVKDSEGISHDETAIDRNVFDNLVNEKEMVLFIDSHKQTDGNITYNSTENACVFTASEDNDSLQTIMAHNGGDSTFLVKDDSASGTTEIGSTEIKTKKQTIAGTNKELVIGNDSGEYSPNKLRLVVCTGDVRIRKDVTFRGIIMAKGTITLEPGAKMISSPLDAAKAFQSQINSSEGVSPKDFFWEGDKYVLGNSQTSNDDKNNNKDSNVYHVEDYVTYKNWKKL